MKLIDIIGTTSAVSPRTAQKAYDCIAVMLEQSNKIVLSFEGVTDCTSAFCNSFIGRIYMKFDPSQVDSLFEITDINEKEVWYKKISNAKLLGINENVRALRKTNLEHLILS